MQETENPNKGATFVHHGLLAKPLTSPIVATRPGNFGKTDVEVHANGRRFIASISPKSPLYAALCDAFGGGPDQWVGNTVTIADDAVVKSVNITATARKDGKPLGS